MRSVSLGKAPPKVFDGETIVLSAGDKSNKNRGFPRRSATGCKKEPLSFSRERLFPLFDGSAGQTRTLHLRAVVRHDDAAVGLGADRERGHARRILKRRVDDVALAQSGGRFEVPNDGPEPFAGGRPRRKNGRDALCKAIIAPAAQRCQWTVGIEEVSVRPLEDARRRNRRRGS